MKLRYIFAHDVTCYIILHRIIPGSRTLLVQNFSDGVTATMVLSGSGPYWALWHNDIGAKCIGVTHIGGDDRCAQVCHHHHATP